MEISNQALTSSLPRGGARVRGGVRVRGGGVRVRGGLLGVAGNVGINGIQTLNQVHDEVFIDEVNHVKNKRSNPSLDRRRCVENLEKAVSRLVEVCGISVVACFHNQAISKLEIIGDNKTIDNLDDGMRKALDNALALSYQNGSDSLHYVNLRKYQTENPNLLSELDKVNACHLPKTDFKLISEKEQFIKFNNNSNLKKTFTSMFKAEGFGRQTSCKGGRYGKEEFRPKWYNDDLHSKCSWAQIRGVEKPKDWSGVWTYFMYDIILACYRFYLPEEEIDNYNNKKEFTCEQNIEEINKSALTSEVSWNHENIQSSTQHLVEVPVPLTNPLEIVSDDQLHIYPVEVGTDDLDDILNNADVDLENILDYCQNESSNFDDLLWNLDESLVSLCTPTASSTQISIASPQPARSPVSVLNRTEVAPPQETSLNVVDILNTPAGPSIKRKVCEGDSVHIDESTLKSKLTGGWLKCIFDDSDIAIFGVLQICEILKKEKITLLKVSDGTCVTWQASGTSESLARIVELRQYSLIEVTKASIQNGYRLIIEDFDIVCSTLDAEILLHAEVNLEFLDKAFYAQTFLKKGMISSTGKKVDEHPGYQLTPVRLTRSKAKVQAAEDVVPFKKLKTGGFTCQLCDKPYKTERNFLKHKCSKSQ